MAAPDDALIALLDTLTSPIALNPTSPGRNLFKGMPVSSADGYPRQGVWVIDNGGPVNLRYLGQALNHRVHSVQVYVRSPQYDSASGKSLADACFTAIDCATVAGYISVRCREAGPAYIGVDEEQCHSWSINVEMARDV